MSELNNISDETKETLKNVSKEAVVNSGEFLETLKGKAADLKKDVLVNTKSMGKVLVESVAKNPYKALGVAFLLGVVCARYKK